jgi:chemotaxis protein MotB
MHTPRFSRLLDIPVVLSLAMPLLLGACVTRGTLDEAVAERDALAAERDRLTADNQLLTEKTWVLSATTLILAKELELQDLEMAQLEQEQQELADDLLRWKILGAVKMALLADGLHVVLPHDVLFESGESTPSAQGRQVLAELAGEIKPLPYEVAVVGFTDNVPIGPRLVDRFPSNWELAGMRAAGVVRVLQQEGVPSDQMLAVSRGEGGAIASNDTVEGRAQNRRIDIRLRPIATR